MIARDAVRASLNLPADDARKAISPRRRLRSKHISTRWAVAIADCGLRLRDRPKGGRTDLTTGCRDRCEGSSEGCTRRFGIVGLSLRSRDYAKRRCLCAAVRDPSGQGEGRRYGRRSSRYVARLVQQPGDAGERHDPTRMVIDAVRRPQGTR